MKKPYIYATLIIFLFSFYSYSEDSTPYYKYPKFDLINKSTIQIISNKITTNYEQPWCNGYLYQSIGSGFIIDHKGKKCIITNAHVVDNASSIRLRKVGSDDEYDATVEYISNDRDLALIAPFDEGFYEGTQPLELEEGADIGDRVSSFGFPIGGKTITMTQGIISRIDFGHYYQSGFDNLLFQVDAALNPGISGGPAISRNKVVGVNFQGLTATQNIGYIIPTSVINQFLSDIGETTAKAPYVSGVPFISVKTIPLQNPQLRKVISLLPGETGVLITEISGLESEKELLMVDDVLMAVDDLSIGNQGNINLYTNDNISWRALISSKQIGDNVLLRIKRKGDIINIAYPLTHNYSDSFIIPFHKLSPNIDYVVLGGLVIIELNQHILNSMDLDDKPQLSKHMNNFRKTGSDTDQRVLIISNILYHPVNAYYERYKLTVINAIGNEKVKNIHHLLKMIEQSKEKEESIILKCSTPNMESLTIGFIWDDLNRAIKTIIREYGAKENVY